MFRCSIYKFTLTFGFLWLVALAYFHYTTLRNFEDPLEFKNEDKNPKIIKEKLFEWPKLPHNIISLHKKLNLTNPGHLGSAVVLPSIIPQKINEEIKKSWQTYKINEFVSNLIPLDRDLPDIRPEYCKNVKYLENLPKTSVIMVFHNEPLSLILRSIFAVFKRTPESLLEEILLVDDASTHDNLKKTLEKSIKNYSKVKIIRIPVRVGLIKARMFGCINANGPALVFMDAHIEVTHGWLEPLLDPLVKNPFSCTVPVLDTLNKNTFAYEYNDNPETYMVGGFNWNLIHKWIAISEREKTRMEHSCAPIRTPTMIGAFFVIMKDNFIRLGMYDEGYEIWGAENLELSFKVWCCGGEMFQIPCSHAGHLFRNVHPYTYPGGGSEVRRNTDRLAEVWLDDYKRFYYRSTNFEGNRNFGDVSTQKKLRNDLKCKSFEWFIENVYPEVEFDEKIRDKV